MTLTGQEANTILRESGKTAAQKFIAAKNILTHTYVYKYIHMHIDLYTENLLILRSVYINIKHKLFYLFNVIKTKI